VIKIKIIKILIIVLMVSFSLPLSSGYDVDGTDYQYYRETLNTNLSNDMIYPFVDENPDGDASDSTYYGQHGNFYYDNDSFFIFGNDTSSRCGFSTIVDGAKQQSVSCASPPSGLVSYWTFDNNNAWDPIGGNNGTLNGGVTTGATGQVKNAYDFDGTDDYVETNTDVMPSSDQPFSISVWINTDVTDSSYHTPVSDTISDAGVALELTNNNNFRAKIKYSSSNALLETTITPTTGEWYHILLMYDGTDSALYINGTQEATATSHGYDKSTNPFSIGYLTNNNDNEWDGRLDNVQIYDRALTENEVHQLYDATKPTAGNDPTFGAEQTRTAPDNHTIILNSPMDGQNYTSLNMTLNVTVIDNQGPNLMEVNFFNNTGPTLIGNTTGVTNDSIVTQIWDNLKPSTTYEWYVFVQDIENTTTSNTWSFTTDTPEITGYLSPNGTIKSNQSISVYVKSISNLTNTNVTVEWYVNDDNVKNSTYDDLVIGDTLQVGSLGPSRTSPGDIIYARMTPTTLGVTGDTIQTANVTIEIPSITMYFDDIYGRAVKGSIIKIDNTTNINYFTYSGKIISTTQTASDTGPSFSGEDNIFDGDLITSSTSEAEDREYITKISIPKGSTKINVKWQHIVTIGGSDGTLQMWLYDTTIDDYTSIYDNTIDQTTITSNININNTGGKYDGRLKLKSSGLGEGQKINIYEVWSDTSYSYPAAIYYPYNVSGSTQFTADDSVSINEYMKTYRVISLDENTNIEYHSYLIPSNEGIIVNFRAIEDTTADPLPDVLITSQIQIDGQWTTINQKKTDDSGSLQMNLVEDTSTRFLFSKSGFLDKQKTLTPIEDTYTIIMEKDRSLNYTNVLQTVSYKFEPYQDVLDENKSYDLNFSIFDTAGQLSLITFNVSYNGTSVGHVTSTDSFGTTLEIDLDTTGRSGEVNAVGYAIVNNTVLFLDRTWYIDIITPQGYSVKDMNNYVDSLSDEKKNMFGLLVFIGIIGIVGAISVVSPVGAGLVGVLLAMASLPALGILSIGQVAIVIIVIVTTYFIVRGVAG